jgi:hypothetical protein
MQIPELIPGIEPHDELNPQLWQGEQLRSDVKQALLRIARKFEQYLDINVQVEDVIVTGSQASYNYTQHSDLDLHLIIDYKTIECDQPVEVLLDTKRKLWKFSHDITIHGVPVELYAEDTAKPVKGSSYSILTDQWRVKPQKATTQQPEGIERIALAWITVIREAVQAGTPTALQSAKDLLMHYRQQSLALGGEMSRGNLVFKMLRNTGVISMLMQALTQAQDQELSLPE